MNFNLNAHVAYDPAHINTLLLINRFKDTILIILHPSTCDQICAHIRLVLYQKW